jgi:uncharacterized protein (TIGR03435 family)
MDRNRQLERRYEMTTSSRSGWEQTLRWAVAIGTGVVTVCISVGAFPVVHAQVLQVAPGALPAFEVASIKVHDPDDPASGNFFQGVDRWVARSYTLRQLVRTAYQVQDYRVVGGPPWADTVRYDIDAKASADDVQRGTAQGEAPARLLMVRTLLAERFKLRLRQEERELPIYALTLARSDGQPGPELRPVERRNCAAGAGGDWCGIRGQGPGKVIGRQVTIDTIVLGLAGAVDRVVVNRTGLAGVFDFTLQYTAARAELTNAEPPGDVSGPSIFTAMEEQLGLRLRAERAPVDVFLIESAEKPTN